MLIVFDPEIGPIQCGRGSEGKKGVLLITHSSSITGDSPSNFFVSYKRHSVGETYPSGEIQLVYSTASCDRAKELF